ncbi:facilitated trehalose transporter Tret1-like [Diorhabda sublineata]|uniref:facilitated trehalose transporter Tret1-like n=1 Tax=Diorhabda sublineata TaxID=1163346 RepID=UPI0024E04A05|nr:facilitated trehalose transporter Tret1-like [Diorhabda sublineata]
MVASAPNRSFLYIAACTANVASFIAGTSLGWSSPEIPKLRNPNTTTLFHPTTTSQEGWIVSLLALAAAVGPFGGGVLSDAIGRKKTLLSAILPFAIASAINVFAKSTIFFYATRFLCGLGVGVVFTVIPMYVGEIADDDVRGSLGSLMQLFVVTGMLFSYSLGPFVSIITFNSILIFPPILFFLIFLLFVPESPYYLIQSDDLTEALDAMIVLRGRDTSLMQKELEVMKVQVEIEKKNRGNVVDVFKSRGLRTAFFLSIGLVSFQQLSGVNVIIFYAQTIFADAGVDLAPEVCTIIIGFVQVVAGGLTPILVDRCGKRCLLLLSALGMALSEGVLALFFYFKDNQRADVSNLGWIPLSSVVIYIIMFGLGLGPLPWAVLGEIFPGNVKSSASSATASVSWILGFFMTNYFDSLTDLIGKCGTFGIFAGFCAFSALFIFKRLPETSGKNVHEIQYILSGGSRKASYTF